MSVIQEIPEMGTEVSLTPSQRLEFDVYGFVLLKQVLCAEEIKRAKDALYRLREEPDLAALNVYVNRRNAFHFHVGHLLEYDSVLLEYAAHPRLLPLVREIVGGPIRLEETEAIINSREPETAPWDPATS